VCTGTNGSYNDRRNRKREETEIPWSCASQVTVASPNSSAGLGESYCTCCYHCSWFASRPPICDGKKRQRRGNDANIGSLDFELRIRTLTPGADRVTDEDCIRNKLTNDNQLLGRVALRKAAAEFFVAVAPVVGAINAYDCTVPMQHISWRFRPFTRRAAISLRGAHASLSGPQAPFLGCPEHRGECSGHEHH